MGWGLVYDHFDPRQEGLREALCTLGNGYFATRGAAEEARADGVHYPGTYLAGGYDRLKSEIAGETVETEDLVNMPNWLPLTFRVAGEDWVHVRSVNILAYRQELDLKHGMLSRSIRFVDGRGRRFRVSSRRLVSMRDPHLAAIEMELTAENWAGRIEVCSALDGRVVNAGVLRYRNFDNQHLEPIAGDANGQGEAFLEMRTKQSGLRLAEAARTRLHGVGGPPPPVDWSGVAESGYAANHLAFAIDQGMVVRVEKVVAVYSSRDFAISECGEAARESARSAPDFQSLQVEHAMAWDHLWRHFDIEIELAKDDGGRAAMILRLHLFHLLQTASPNAMDLDVGIPARGLHGEAYRGHVFWDELFIFPLLNLRLPEVTRALLKYRYRRLNQARRIAREAGYAGAMYPWQSGSDGREESQRVHLNPRSGRWLPDNSALQRHVNIAVAYNVWQYYQCTGDMEFLSYYGAEMILEIARFWASLASMDVALGRFEIRGVMGPDEYHDAYPGTQRPGLDNNAYTNIMAVWVLCRALDVLDLLAEDRRAELTQQLGIRKLEIEHWRAVSKRMYVVFQDGGIISQFEGYRLLEEFDWIGCRRKYGDIHRLDRLLEAEGDSPNRYKVSKQADVLMLFYLLSVREIGELFTRLGYPFDENRMERNVEYYLGRTSHGSTLSRVVHSWVLARLDRKRSWQLFTEALQSDIADVQGGTTAEGIHLGAMAGTVDLLQRCYTGIETRGDVLWIDPRLPEALTRLKVRLRYRGHSLELDINRRQATVRAIRTRCESIKVGFGDEVHLLAGGEQRTFTLPAEGTRRPRGPGRQVRP